MTNRIDFDVPKDQWGDGPWQSEPDRAEFRHAGLPCLLNRSPSSGAWCGYVGVPPGHPARQNGRLDLEERLEVHGGVTYGPSPCSGAICHVPLPGETDDVVWIGFDCNHHGDYAPMLATTLARVPSRLAAWLPRRTYRDQAWVTEETKRLAEQLGAMVEP